MTFWLMAMAITLSSFAFVTAVMSVLVTLAAPAAVGRVDRYAPAPRARLLFRLRMLPSAAALVVAGGVGLPIYFWFEPKNTDEPIARTLIVGAVLGAAILVRSAWRGVAALRATNRVLRAWHARARPVTGVEAPLPIVAIEESFPIVAVLGVARPVLFIAERVLDECSDEEVRAMVRHECAHVAERDNLKRFLIAISPDFMGPGPVDRAWSRAAEEAADAAAVADRRGAALALAQALIRVARLAPGPAMPELASAFHLGGCIESRVRRLVDGHSADRIPRAIGPKTAGVLTGLFAGAVVFAAPVLHQIMERLVSLLP
jgi:Zn-dependent protease with chaperone function